MIKLNNINKCILYFGIFSIVSCKVDGTARLLSPPSRSSLWRFPEYKAFNPVENLNDDKLNCGGFEELHGKNKGLCGLCGDNYSDKTPRANEDGGQFGKGIIAKKYKEGEEINVTIEITQDHKGYFEFRLCPHKNAGIPPTQSCFDQNILEIVNYHNSNTSSTDEIIDEKDSESNSTLQIDEKHGEKCTKYNVTESIGFYNLTVRLPPQVKCVLCLFQFTYIGSDRVENCTKNDSENGEENCPQELLRACSDIAIY